MDNPIKPRKSGEIQTEASLEGFGGASSGADIFAESERARLAINAELARLGRPVQMIIDGGASRGAQQQQQQGNVAEGQQLGGRQKRINVGTGEDYSGPGLDQPS